MTSVCLSLVGKVWFLKNPENAFVHAAKQLRMYTLTNTAFANFLLFCLLFLTKQNSG